jgi:hypothetical protein
MTHVADHPFTAVPWWAPCEVCKLGAPAHAGMSPTSDAWMRVELRELPYRCPYCVDRFIDPCPHGKAGALGLDRQPLKEQSA